MNEFIPVSLSVADKGKISRGVSTDSINSTEYSSRGKNGGLSLTSVTTISTDAKLAC